MVSSLAAQLAQGASLNASLLVDRSRRKPADSYLFSLKEAQKHDLDAIHALGLNGFTQLMAMDPSIGSFERPLFSDTAKATDRTLLTSGANAELNGHIASFLPLLGPYLLEAPAGKVLEWLVRRFRINEFNVQELLTLFIPYHESPHFAKIVTLLHIDDNSMFRFLAAYKTTAKPLPRGALVTEMLKDTDLARFVSGLLPNALKSAGAGAHKALVIFHTGVLLDFLAQNKDVDEGTTAFLLPAATEPLQLEPDDVGKIKSSLGSLLVIAALSQKCRITPKVLKAILSTVASCAQQVSAKQFVRTLLCICAPQDTLEKFPRSLVTAIMRLPAVDSELRDVYSWVGAEKLIDPLVVALTTQLAKEPALDLLESILTYTKTPADILRHGATALLQKLAELGDATDPSMLNARRALSNLYQRHPDIVQDASKAAMEDEDKRELLDQIVDSLSIVGISSLSKQTQGLNTDFDIVVASISADASVRARAIGNLYNILSSSESAADAMKAALRARIEDTEPAVLEALYAQPTLLLPLVLEDTSGYLSTLTQILHNQKDIPSRTVVRLHLAFVATHLSSPLREADAALADRIVDELFFSYLLFTKPRQKTAAVVWEILEACENNREEHMGIVRYELLGGCVDAVRWEESHRAEGMKDDGSHKNIELLTKINMAVAAKMADNILASNYYDRLFENILAKLHDSSPYARALGYLVARALLSRLSGEHQINAAHRVLQAMKLNTLEGMGDFMRGVDNLGVVSHSILGTAVVLKPKSRHTFHRLQISVLTTLPMIPRPAALTLDWLQTPSTPATNDTRPIRYVQLMRAVYKLGNSSASLPLLSTQLLRALFMNLGSDALIFLTGIWLAPQDDYENHIRVSALRHAAAFLEADYAIQNRLDFQTILPAILFAVQSADPRVREAALSCVVVLVKMTTTIEQASAVYAFDMLYGDKSTVLQYLDWADFRKYVATLGTGQNHLVHDSGYLRVLHQEYLSTQKSDSKKQAGYKQRIMCYLLSHVNACQLPDFKLSLLKSVELTSSEVKARMLLPTVQEHMDGSHQSPDSQAQAVLPIVMSSFDDSSVADLNDTSKSTWAIYEQIVQAALYLVKDAKDVVIYQLQHGVFDKLSADRKVALSTHLLKISVQNVDAAKECKEILRNLLTDIAITIRLLVIFQPAAVEQSEQSSRASLTLLAEVLASMSQQGSLDLVICLLETLKRVTHDASMNSADRAYTEQLLMTAVEGVVTSLPDSSSISPGLVRLDVLVDLIRAAEDPQTFHQALLLMASLARLAPDAVLHNIMPVFTFMGSNVFHRDDAYSFRVTIESIVPVMVTSLKTTYTSALDLYVGSRDFLCIFTDASNHIPRHRRTQLFLQLIDVLGPDEFLAPICMLLVDRVSNRVVKQNSEDARTSLSLGLAAIEHYSTQQRIVVLVEIMREVLRMLAKANDGDQPEATFLAPPSDDDRGVQASAIWRRRALSFILFCDYALRESTAISRSNQLSENDSISDLLSLLLKVAVLPDPDQGLDKVIAAARSAMTSTLRIMSASVFVMGVTLMIHSRDAKVQMGALNLLGERLTSVTDETRRTMTAVVVKINSTIKKILASNPDDDLLIAAFSALRSISQTQCPGEESSLAVMIPLVLDIARRHSIAPAAFSALLSLWYISYRLGPRIIPHIRRIVQECAASSDLARRPPTEALEVLQSTLSSIPTFWGEVEILLVMNLFLGSCTTTAKADTNIMTPVVKTMTKRLPSKMLLSTSSSAWSALSSSTESVEQMVGFFVFLRRSLRTAARPVVLEHLRPLSKLFQDAFEIVSTGQNSLIQRDLISAFLELVVKLNETAFRPLFRRLSDWAFTDTTSSANVSRAVTFCNIYSALLEYFKALVVPYLSFLRHPFLRILDQYAADVSQGPNLWTSLVIVLTKTLTFDEGGFWRGDKMQQLVSALIKQIPVCIHIDGNDGKKILSDCLVAAMDAVNDDTLLKSMNLDILMHTRSEDSRLRLYSLACNEALWRAHGGKLLGFVAETATFIAECAEDENDSVVREAHRLKEAVESIAGKIHV
ncbi:hypothetical protein POSPLADRAFT_1154787 [Postia placenta MAD-698-R-SB12]|uniref:U3 small nucleolar RNA-associated protein 10 n=1 Tax=Postia placenta MAD-698-R-SB12 TaxID=670580 RepID=A0A1X6MNN5_9APHY|nr:hypothetical protein POSPLADRAFT_1154787 [Postia placenta MAD-698-R-SB12]OSX58041.1 hypothetical protein POSPLADRAFT_1154787 [Postia placenta MAD-698-R-SB12]